VTTRQRRKPAPFPREVVELQARVREVDELLADDWRGAFERNSSDAFQTRLDLLMHRNDLTARIKAILNQPPPRPTVRQRAIGLAQLLGFAVCALVGSIAVSLLGFAALQWLVVTPLAMGLLVVFFMGMARD
jgi:hypothetical protein